MSQNIVKDVIESGISLLTSKHHGWTDGWSDGRMEGGTVDVLVMSPPMNHLDPVGNAFTGMTTVR